MTKKTPRHASAAQLNLVSTYGERSEEDIQTIVLLAAKHPRQFWAAAKPLLSDRCRDRHYPILRAFFGHESLARAGLSFAAKHSRSDGVGRNDTLQILLDAALSIPGKSPAYYLNRIERARPLLSRVSAGDIFEAVFQPALGNNPHAALARLMPAFDSPDREEARRHTYGQTSFASKGLYNEQAMAEARAIVHAQTHGLPARIPARRDLCDNAFFWVARRYHETHQAGQPEAALWREAGCILIQRVPRLIENTHTLALCLGLEPFRQALGERAPKLGSPGNFWSSREVLVGEAFLLASHGEAKGIIDYLATGQTSKIAPAEATAEPTTPRYNHGCPDWALALLAGHPPDPAWMPAPASLEFEATFQIPKALADKSRSGSICAEDFKIIERDSGARYDATRLLKELGRPLPLAPRKKNAP